MIYRLASFPGGTTKRQVSELVRYEQSALWLAPNGDRTTSIWLDRSTTQSIRLSIIRALRRAAGGIVELHPVMEHSDETRTP